MIAAEFKQRKGTGIVEFSIKGHSGYSESGSDIVCAAVSSAAYMAVNTITDVIGAKPEIDLSDGFLVLKLSLQDALKCSVITEGLKLHVLALSEQYQDFIKVKISEV
ncbi:MAG: ribosomal-processing cysteine protease Prp [Candidatus Limousia pullorum]